LIHPRLIIKADDFGRSPLIDPWRRFTDLCLNYRAVPSIGIVGADFAQHHPAQLLARYLSEVHKVEFWNHSFNHVDLRSLSSVERIEDTQRAQQAVADVLGRPPEVYGAPFNLLDDSVLRDITAASSFAGIYFADLQASDYRVEQLISAQHLLTVEMGTQLLYPVRFDKFLAEFVRKGKPATIIFQVHPAHWSEKCFAEFSRSLEFLVARGYQVMTATQYLASRKISEGHRAAAPDYGTLVGAAERIYEDAQSDARILGGGNRAGRRYYADRFCRNIVGAAHFLREHGLGTQAELTDRCHVLDIGTGIGNWTAAAAATAPNVIAVGYDRDSELLTFARDEFDRYFDDSRCLFVRGSAERLALLNQRFDYCICNNALNYMQIVHSLAEMARVLRNGGLALIGVQTELYPLLDVLRFAAAGQRQAAVDQINRYFGNRARKFGFLSPTAFISYWDNQEFMAAARFAGFSVLLSGISLPDDYGSLFGVPALWGYLVMVNASTRAQAMQGRGGIGITARQLETLIGLRASDYCFDALQAMPSLAAEIRNLPALLWTIAATSREPLDRVIENFERAGIPIASGVRARTITLGKPVLDADWQALAVHYRSEPRAAAEYRCAKWFAGLCEPTEDLSIAEDNEEAIFELGAALRQNDKLRFMAALRSLYTLNDSKWKTAARLAGPCSPDGFEMSGRRADPAIGSEGECWIKAIDEHW
jgi:ubiquinone/menaquinone biosynthesis C-methylase UbiE